MLICTFLLSIKDKTQRLWLRCLVGQSPYVYLNQQSQFLNAFFERLYNPYSSNSHLDQIYHFTGSFNNEVSNFETSLSLRKTCFKFLKIIHGQ